MRLVAFAFALAMFGIAGVARADTVTDIVTLNYTMLNAEQHISFSFADGQVQDKLNPVFFGNVIPNAGSVGATGSAELDFFSPLQLKTVDPTGLKTSYLLTPDATGLYTTTPVDPNEPDGLTIFNFVPGVYNQPNSYAQIFLGSQSTLLPIQNVTLTITQIGGAAAVTPEPSTFALLGTGLLGVVGVVRRRSTSTV